MRPVQKYVLDGVSGAVNQSAIITSQFVATMSVHVTSTGTAVGTLKVQASNDDFGLVDANGAPAPVNWVDIPSATVSVTAASNTLIPKFDLSYNFLKFVYTFTSGTGNITVKIHGFGIN